MSFVNLLFGHLVGDYLLQNNWMALSKNNSYYRCFIHCLIYTLSIIIFIGIFDYRLILLVFVSHFVIDKYKIAELWLKFIKGRSLNWYYNYIGEIGKKNILRGSITTFVWIVVDNTIHLLVIYYGWKLLK